MNTISLQEGQVFKSYKALCEIIEETPKKTKEKKDRHYEVFRQYFDFEHISPQKIKILKVHKRGNFKNTYTTRSKYVNELSTILLDELNKNNGELFVTMKELMEIFGMITKVYGDMKVRNDILNSLPTSQPKDAICVNSICYQINHKLSSMITRCLLRLKEQGVINYQKKIYIITQDGNKIANATIDKAIKQVEQDVLDEKKCKDIHQVFLQGRQSSYYSEVNNRLKERYGILGYYKGVFIKIQCVINNIPKYSQEEVQAAKQALLTVTHNNIYNLLISRKEKHDEKIYRAIGEVKHVSAEFPKNYRDYVDIIVKTFIKSPQGCI